MWLLNTWNFEIDYYGLRCARTIRHTPDFEDLVWFLNVKYLIGNIYIDFILLELYISYFG